jgi:photosystem I P700 chlorophyll a apoprotein A2
LSNTTYYTTAAYDQFVLPIKFTSSDYHSSTNSTNHYSRAVSTRIYSGLSQVHSIDAFASNSSELSVSLLSSHGAHFCVITSWLASLAFHIGWSGNYCIWLLNPVYFLPCAHYLFDPHLGFFGLLLALGIIIVCISGCYSWFLVAGISRSVELFYVSLAMQLTSLITIWSSRITFATITPISRTLSFNIAHKYSSTQQQSHTPHQHVAIIDIIDDLYATVISYPVFLRFKLFNSSVALRLLASASIFWCSHLISVSIPASQANSHNLSYLCTSILPALFSFTWCSMSEVLSFGCGLTPGTLCIPTSDVAHHHLALGVLLILFSGLSSLVRSTIHYRFLGYSQRSSFTYGSADNSIESYHSKLSIGLAGAGTITSLVAQHTYSLCPYPLLALDPVTSLSRWTNHQYIAGLLLVGSLVHTSLAIIRDFVSQSCSYHRLATTSSHKSTSSESSLQ